MKPIALFALVLVMLGGVVVLLPAHYVQENETTTQLLWNRHEALVFSAMRRDGWSGNYARLGIQMARGLFGAVPQYDTNRAWVSIARITTAGIERHIEHGTGF